MQFEQFMKGKPQLISTFVVECFNCPEIYEIEQGYRNVVAHIDFVTYLTTRVGWAAKYKTGEMCDMLCPECNAKLNNDDKKGILA